MPGLFFYNYQHCNHSSLLRGKTYEGIKNGDLDLFASIHFLLRGKTKNTSFLPEILNASIRFPLAREDVIQNRECIVELASIHFPLAREDSKFHQKTPVFILCSCIFPPYNFLLFLQQIRISVSFVYYFFILTVRIPFRFHVHLWFAPPTSSLYILFHQNSSGSVTSNPGFAPICSTLFLYLSPR